MTTALARVDERVALQLNALREALLAVREIESLDAARELRDKARALEAYTRKRADAGELYCRAGELRLRAERRIGELLGPVLGAGEAGARGGRGKKAVASADSFPRQEASRLRALATLTDAEFERRLAEAARKGEVPTRSALVALAKGEESRRDHQERKAAARDKGPRGYDSFDELLAALEDGREQPFGTIYADPPWSYQNKVTRGNANDQYTLASMDEIKAMPVERLAAKDCTLFMWATSPLLFEQGEVLKAWGFTYCSQAVWIKDGMGLGNRFRICHELLLVGVRGSPAWADRGVRSWIKGGDGRHSEKPHKFREVVERVSAGPYVELFARQWADGWASMGNEVNGKAPLADAGPLFPEEVGA